MNIFSWCVLNVKLPLFSFILYVFRSVFTDLPSTGNISFLFG